MIDQRTRTAGGKPIGVDDVWDKTLNAIWRSDPNALEQRDTFAAVIRAVEGERSMFYWAVSGGNPKENDAYGIYFNPIENTISLIIEVNGN